LEEIFMVNIIMGEKGAGKTKMLINMVNESVKTESGNVVCIEAGTKLTYDINYAVRLIDITEYKISDFDALFFFINGLYAGNHDITAIYIDSIFKICKRPMKEFEAFLKKLEAFADSEGIRVVITVSANPAEATDFVRSRFMIA